MFMEERQREIAETVKRKGSISVSDIQERYGISGDSARRDLRLLEERGLLRRTHGGAIKPVPRGSLPAEDYNPRDLASMRENYLAMARQAVKHIQKDDVIYLTTSSIGYYMAGNLPAEFSFTVVVNSVTIADELRKYDNLSVILLGGEMSRRGNCHDYYTVNMVKSISLDKAFLSHTALSLEFGASLHNSSGVEFARAVMEQSAVNIGLYPNDKIGRNSIFSVCQVQDYDMILLEEGAAADFMEGAREKGTAVELVHVM